MNPMKRIILGLCMVFVGVGAAWGQGSVNWSSVSFSALTTQTNSTTYSPFFGGGATGFGAIGAAGGTNSGPKFRYELLYGAQFNGSTIAVPTTLADLNAWSDSGLSATNNAATPGRLVCISPSTAAATPAGWDAGNTNYIMVVGWSTNLGGSWSAARANLNSPAAMSLISGQMFFGVSKVGYIRPSSVGVNPGATIFANTTNISVGLPIFSTNTQLYIVPSNYLPPPLITSSPSNQTMVAGASVSLNVQASSSVSMTYQWQKNSGAIAGETNSTLTFNPALTNSSGNYSVVVANSSGSVTSAIATLMIYQPVSIVTPPARQLVSYGDTAVFNVVADGFPAPTLQWSFKGTNLAGANSTTLSVPNVTTNQLGNYSVIASNAYSSASGGPATLTMLPSLVTPFAGVNGLWGQPGTLSVVATGSGTLGYQWYKDGVAIGGANGATYYISSLQFTNAGAYSVVVSSAYGSVTNMASSLVVRPSDTLFGIYAGITVQGTIGNSYSIQYSSDLVNWITATNITLDQPAANWTDYSADYRNNPGRYYRVIPAP